MDLAEYKAKELFAQGGLTVKKFVCGDSVEELLENMKTGGVSYPVVLKAQVLTGGRGKAGGIKIVENEAELLEKAPKIFGMDIKGHIVHKLMAIEAADIKREFYLSVILDRKEKSPTIIFSPAGGIDIETTAKEHPELIFKIPVHPFVGVNDYTANYLADKGGMTGDVKKQFAALLKKIYALFISNDLTLCEINPLAICENDELIAIDGKITVDDSAVKRHPDLQAYSEAQPMHPLTREARDFNFLYIPCDDTGNIAVMSNGSGMLMSCIDLITKAGMKVCSVLDLGGGATAERIAEAVRIMLSVPQSKALFINIFGGITRCDEVAGGIKLAIEKGHATRPVIIRFEGTNKSAGLEILSGLEGVTYVDGLREGVVELSKLDL